MRFIYGYIVIFVYVCGEVASFIFTAKYLVIKLLLFFFHQTHLSLSTLPFKYNVEFNINVIWHNNSALFVEFFWNNFFVKVQHVRDVLLLRYWLIKLDGKLKVIFIHLFLWKISLEIEINTILDLRIYHN